LELLQARLEFLADIVDYFVLVESERTLSGNPKPLSYKLNRNLYTKFQTKIIHIIAPVNDFAEWDYEFFQRNYIKKGLENCTDNDIIFVSDADEIINIKGILSYTELKLPALIQLSMYYYFINLKTNATFYVNLVATWSFLKDKNLGFRYRDYPKLTENKISANMIDTGWHFSYLFGYDIGKYQEKIRSFSHQEYNTAYFLDEDRIQRCLQLCIDIFERPFIKLSIDNKSIQRILPFIKNSDLPGLLYKPGSRKYLSLRNIFFILHKKYYRRFKHTLKQSLPEKIK